MLDADSDKAINAFGWTYPAGLVPALTASQLSPRRALTMASAICERIELPVQRKKNFLFHSAIRAVARKVVISASDGMRP